MNAEFFKDDNGFIWLFYAKNIFIRKSHHEQGLIAGTLSKAEVQKQAKKKLEDKERAKRQLIEELKTFEREQFGGGRRHENATKKNGKVTKMMNFMGEFYEDLKVQEGIDDNYLRIDKADVPKLENVFRSMDPNCEAKNFKEYLKFEQDVARRKKKAAEAKVQQSRRRSQASPGIEDPSVTSSEEDDDVTSRKPLDPAKLPTKQLIQTFQMNLRKQNKPMLDMPAEYAFMNSLSMNAHDVRASEYTVRVPKRGELHLYEYDQRLSDQRRIKAELVRRNLLSRKDLMNLYKPPVQQCSVPANNPWLTRSIIQPPRFSTVYQQARCGTV